MAKMKVKVVAVWFNEVITKCLMTPIKDKEVFMEHIREEATYLILRFTNHELLSLWRNT